MAVCRRSLEQALRGWRGAQRPNSNGAALGQATEQGSFQGSLTARTKAVQVQWAGSRAEWGPWVFPSEPQGQVQTRSLTLNTATSPRVDDTMRTAASGLSALVPSGQSVGSRKEQYCCLLFSFRVWSPTKVLANDSCHDLHSHHSQSHLSNGGCSPDDPSMWQLSMTSLASLCSRTYVRHMLLGEAAETD